MAATAITAQGLSKRYQIGQFRAAYGTLRDTLAESAKRLLGKEHEKHSRAEIWALKDVSLEVAEGEVLGIIGRNGAGKSTLLKILTRITVPTEGTASIHGRVGSLLEVGTGFHPELTGRENIYLNGAILGMKRREIARKLPEIVEFSGVETFIDTPVKRFSSGMYVRLAFAVAAHLEPEILLIDEVLSVGDAEFQKRCLGRMEDMSNSGRTVLFVSHNMPAVAQLCDRVILLEGGRNTREGASTDIVAHYLQTTGGSASQRSWPELEIAPGDDLVRLRGVRVIREDGSSSGAIDVRQAVGIEIAFRVLRAGDAVVPKIKIYDSQGNTAFNAMDTDERWTLPLRPSDYVATAWIPGNLLNEGLTTVDVGLVTLVGPRPHHHAIARNAVSFHVHDPGEGGSARGTFTGQWKGVVRPLLKWTSQNP